MASLSHALIFVLHGYLVISVCMYLPFSCSTSFHTCLSACCTYPSFKLCHICLNIHTCPTMTIFKRFYYFYYKVHPFIPPNLPPCLGMSSMAIRVYKSIYYDFTTIHITLMAILNVHVFSIWPCLSTIQVYQLGYNYVLVCPT
jgi:hypothetical protein